MRPILLSLAFTSAALAQFAGLTLPPSGNNQKAAVTQFIGPVQVTIEYSSPAVHGPDGKDRRGQIWGKLVPYGLSNLGFGNGKPGPWRAGANENTVFAVSHPVRIEGQPLAAGRYGFHIIPEKDQWTLIFSKNHTSWGSFFYEENEDALRVKVTPHKHEYREYLTYEFLDRKLESATAELQWEDLAVRWKISVANANEIYLTELRKELRNTPGFNWQGYVNAAQFCLQNNIGFEDGLQWAEASVSMPFVGQKNFQTLSTKAMLLAKLNRNDEAKAVMDAALREPGTTPFQIHQYGRQLLNAKKSKEALEVFELNAKRNGDTWPVHVGLARGYSAVGEYPKALEHARKALPQAPDQINRTSLEGMIKALEKGESVQ